MKRLMPILPLLLATAGQIGRADTPPAHPGAAAAVEPAHRIVLLVDEIKQIRSLPVVLAERLGYLKSADTAVTVMNIRDDVPAADLLADGRVDAVMAYYHHTVVGQSEHQPLETIVVLGVTPGAKVLGGDAATKKFKSLADLKGARIIAGGAGSSKTTVANYLVLAGGNQIGDYTRLDTQGKEANAQALHDGTADLIVAPTPDGDYYESQGAKVFADLTTTDGTQRFFGNLFPSSAIYMSTDRIRAHPEIAQFLADAFVRTLHYINTHSPEEIAALIPESIRGKDPAAYLKVLKEEIPMFATDGRMPAAGADAEWRVMAQFNAKYRPVKVQDTYTDQFVDQALAKLH